MMTDPDLAGPASPNLRIRDLPEDRQRDARSLFDHLRDMSKAAESFADALQLVEFCNTDPSPGPAIQSGSSYYFKLLSPRWRAIALEHAAIKARDFWKGLEPIGSLAGRIADWRPLIDFKRIKAARVAFLHRFPNIDNVRHSLVHPEHYSNPDKNMLGLGPGEMVWRRYDLPDRIQVTIDGAQVGCEVTRENALFLNETARETFASFDAVAHLRP
jgi:hypothetical protein